MKLVTIALACVMALLIALKSQGQIYFSGSFGASTLALKPAGAASIGLNVHNYIIQSGFHAPLSAKDPVLYRITGGRLFEVGEMSSITITGGLGYFDAHYDKEKGYRISGNSTWVASVEYAKDFRGRGQYFIESTLAKDCNFITVGLKYFFVNHKDGCPASW